MIVEIGWVEEISRFGGSEERGGKFARIRV